jgi:hypothetical protein
MIFLDALLDGQEIYLFTFDQQTLLIINIYTALPGVVAFNWSYLDASCQALG